MTANTSRISPAAVADADAASVTAEAFKLAFRHHAAGVALVTADPGEGPVALTATSVFSVSAVPPVLAFSLSELSSSTPSVKASETIVVHILGAERKDLAVLGATSGIDRFADTDLWTRLPTGEPLFLGVPHWIRATITDLVPIGASTLVIARAVEISPPEPADTVADEPLVYHNRTWHALGERSRI